jgi:hypothetical protein
VSAVSERHVGVGSLGELDGDRARTAARPVDEHAVTGHDAGRALQRNRAGLGERRGLGERQALGLVGEHRLWGQRVLGEPALQAEIVVVHVVAPPEAGDVLVVDGAALTLSAPVADPVLADGPAVGNSPP